VNTDESLQLFLAEIDSLSNYTDDPSIDPTSAPSISCATGWTLYNNNYHKFDVAYDFSWSVCESECSDLGASVLCIPDSITNTWISDQLSQSNDYGYNYYLTWIGYSDLPNKDGHITGHICTTGRSITKIAISSMWLLILAGQPVNQNAQILVHRCSVFLIPPQTHGSLNN